MSIAAFAKKPVFGPVKKTKLDLMGIRFMVPPADEGGSFTPPADQAALDKLINSATAKVHKKYEGFDDFKSKAERAEELEAELAKLKGKGTDPDKDGKTTEEKPTGLSPEEVQKQIDEAIAKTRAEERAELALERATTALDKALAGRTVEPAKLLTLDRTKFVTKEHEVDNEAIKTWVDENSAEGPKPRLRDLGQGARDTTPNGSVQAGRDLFDQRHPSKKSS